MDPFTFATGVIGIAGFAIQLAEIIGHFASAQLEVTALVNELNLLAETLKKLDEFLTSATTSANFTSTSCLCTTAKACEHDLQTLLTKLGHKAGSPLMRSVDRAKWPFQAKTIREKVALFHRYNQIFNCALTIHGCELLANSSEKVSEVLTCQLKILKETSEINKALPDVAAYAEKASLAAEEILLVVNTLSGNLVNVEKITQGVEALQVFASNQIDRQARLDEEKDYQEVLDWLSPVDFGETHRSIAKKHEPGTGAWFIDHEVFQSWKTGPVGSVLWCTGIPGAGKTVMASLIVDYIEKTSSITPETVAYVYCDYKNHKRLDVAYLISSLSRQIAARNEQAFQEYRRCFYARRPARKGSDIESLDVSEHCNLMQKLNQHSKNIFIVVDAIDECPEYDERGKEVRSAFLQLLNSLSTTCRLFLTSRPHVNIKRYFPTCSEIVIEATEADLSTFLKSRISSSENLSRIVAKDRRLEGEIMQGILHKANGMFLLAELQFEQVKFALSARKIRTTLENLSKRLEDIYHDALDRVRQQSEQERTIGMRVLAWVTHTKRPLTATELVHAFAIELGDTRFHKDGMINIESLVGACAGLLSLQTESHQREKTVRFVHFTVQEFLGAHSLNIFPDASLDITNTCLTYLTLDDFKRRLSSVDPFYGYAAEYWPAHALLAGKNLDRVLVRQLVRAKHEILTQNWLSCVLKRYSGELRREFPPGFAAAAVSMHGAANVLELFLDSDFPINTTMRGWTPLNLTVSYNHFECVKLLLDAGAEPSEFGPRDESTLRCAVESASDEIVGLILHAIPARDKDTENVAMAFNEAVQARRKSVYPLFLECGCNPASGAYVHPALYAAIDQGFEDDLNLFLSKRPNLNEPNDSRASPLQFAVLRKRWSMIPLLLAAGADPNLINVRYPSVLESAIEKYKCELIELLLDSGADVNRRCIEGGSLLELAVVKILPFYASVLIKLLDHGARLCDDEGDMVLLLYNRNIESRKHCSDVQKLVCDRLKAARYDFSLRCQHLAKSQDVGLEAQSLSQLQTMSLYSIGDKSQLVVRPSAPLPSLRTRFNEVPIMTTLTDLAEMLQKLHVPRAAKRVHLRRDGTAFIDFDSAYEVDKFRIDLLLRRELNHRRSTRRFDWHLPCTVSSINSYKTSNVDPRRQLREQRELLCDGKFQAGCFVPTVEDPWGDRSISQDTTWFMPLRQSINQLLQKAESTSPDPLED